MIVLSLTDCPPSLRGELTRWLLEINTGVYIGHVSARVRDRIWERVVEEASKGRAIMVFSSGEGEQRLDFRTHNSDWEPIDFDGLKLMLRPSPSWLSNRTPKTETALKDGFSKVAKIRTAKRMTKIHRKDDIYKNYVIIDVETTGLSPEHHEVMEIGAIKVRDHQVEATFQALVRIEGKIPRHITQLTGLTDEILQQDGRPHQDVLLEFLQFIEDLPIIAHNSDFDHAFLRTLCIKSELPPISNKRVDTMSLAKRYLDQVPNYRLETLVAYLDIPVTGLHRSLNDCFATMQLYQKLNEIRKSGS